MQDGMTLAIGGGATLHASLGFLTRRALKTGLGHRPGRKPAAFAMDQSVDRRRQGRRRVRGRQLSDHRAGDGQRSGASRPSVGTAGPCTTSRSRAAGADIALITVGDMSPDATIFRHASFRHR